VDPREEVEKTIAEERRRRAQAGCPLVCHRATILPAPLSFPQRPENQETAMSKKAAICVNAPCGVHTAVT
jgi:hypothetical protein